MPASTDTGYSDKYATTSDLWQESLPDQVTPADFSPGTRTISVLTGTSTGTIVISELPKDDYAMRVKISLAGQVGVARFQCSSDAGVTYFPTEFLTSTDVSDIVDSQGRKTGLLIVFANHIADNPSFILNDYWSFTTTGPPDVKQKLITTSEDIDSVIGHNLEHGRYHLPLKSWPRSMVECCCHIAARSLLERRGYDLKGRDKLYGDRADRAEQWLNDIAHYKKHPNIVDQGQGSYTPDIILGPDKYRIIRKNYTP